MHVKVIYSQKGILSNITFFREQADNSEKDTGMERPEFCGVK